MFLPDSIYFYIFSMFPSNKCIPEGYFGQFKLLFYMKLSKKSIVRDL